jgi:ATP-dependent Lon protease
MNHGRKRFMKIIGKLRHKQQQNEAPLAILKDTIILPHLVGSINAPSASEEGLVKAAGINKLFVLAYPVEEGSGLRSFGVLSRILQGLRMPDGTTRLVVEASERVKIGGIRQHNGVNFVAYDILPDYKNDAIVARLCEQLKKEFSFYAKEHNINEDVIESVNKSKGPEEVFSRVLIAVNALSVNEKVEIFSIDDIKQRFESLISLMDSENEIHILKRNINDRIRQKMAKRNRDFFLQEQLKEINNELNDGKADLSGVSELEEKFTALTLTKEAESKVKKELLHLKRLQPMTPEAGMLRSYLETVADLPWGHYKEDTLSLKEAENILNNEHYGLEKPKERILDFIAVRKIAPQVRGPILCFVGPPGVGKTSLASSIARALNRDFVRLSLGGVRDETEIRGHRRTYLGSLPGKIIQAFQKIDSANPVFLLDEIDKMSADSHRGDPASALLETLDPEQNKTFTDTYLELGFDLSRVLFIATANSLSGIPYPLLDRLEVIELSGYTELEKSEIARRFLIPKQLKENGIEQAELTLSSEAMQTLIREYTNESGVRNLERELSRLIRKIIRRKLYNGELQDGKEIDKPLHEAIDKALLYELLGKPKYYNDELLPLSTGMAMGLAWTERGGVALPIEAHLMAGSGRLDLTGKLGEVMKESAQIAYSFIRSYMEKRGFDADFFKNKDIHIHAPEGAVPKDGPSAGITIASALYSAISGKTMRKGVAMTGELTLSGQLLPIGGLKEKSLAAHRHHYNTVLISRRNERDLDEIPKEVFEEMDFKTFDTADEALTFLFDI